MNRTAAPPTAAPSAYTTEMRKLADGGWPSRGSKNHSGWIIAACDALLTAANALDALTPHLNWWIDNAVENRKRADDAEKAIEEICGMHGFSSAMWRGADKKAKELQAALDALRADKQAALDRQTAAFTELGGGYLLRAEAAEKALDEAREEANELEGLLGAARMEIAQLEAQVVDLERAVVKGPHSMPRQVKP